MDIQNELVWSHSRGRAFHDCRRAYWYTYYGSWGGWDSAAPEEAVSAAVDETAAKEGPLATITQRLEAAVSELPADHFRELEQRFDAVVGATLKSPGRPGGDQR